MMCFGEVGACFYAKWLMHPLRRAEGYLGVRLRKRFIMTPEVSVLVMLSDCTGQVTVWQLRRARM